MTEVLALCTVVFGAGGVVVSMRAVQASVADLGRRLRVVELQLAKLMPNEQVEDRW